MIIIVMKADEYPLRSKLGSVEVEGYDSAKTSVRRVISEFCCVCKSNKRRAVCSFASTSEYGICLVLVRYLISATR